ncbi:glycosyltransferase family 2 protein [uncultured Winogradskyella sp.]|uniref:glycosyltransferase family 2 protein n=1 Tax=Winogradskyella sp. 4-2091 TaxID=3381659 RepID=UPI0026388CDF|nr:glycosyltransferase family 2 protein [uncultured Winogradskyella sp.]
MRVSLVITVKNEARLLRQNLLYHLGIGIEKVFVYFDGTTDNGQQLIKDIEGVETNASISAEKYSHLGYLKHLCDNRDVIHTARQCLNTYDAQMKCKALGVDWLISLDADELFLTDYIKPINLSHFFEAYKAYDVIQFKTLEVLARKMAYDKVMLEEVKFKIQKNFKSHFNRIYFKFFNPYNKQFLSHPHWLGHDMGKLAIRVDSNTIPKNVHRYQTIDKTALKSEKGGYLLHYHLYDYQDFIKKYQNFKAHPNTFLSGNKIGSLKTLWRDMVNDPQFDDLFLQRYFEDNILITEAKFKTLQHLRYFPFIKRKAKAIADVTYPQTILKSVKQSL